MMVVTSAASARPALAPRSGFLWFSRLPPPGSAGCGWLDSNEGRRAGAPHCPCRYPCRRIKDSLKCTNRITDRR